MSEARVIKKYPNRRLYDTEISSYITLDDVRKLVQAQEDFRVVDARSGEDLTRSILLQIIIEQEADGEPIFTVDVLQQIIRCYGDTMQGLVSNWFEQSLGMFREQQKAYEERMKSMLAGDPLAMVRNLTAQNLSIWKEVQESFLRAASGANPPAPGRQNKKEDIGKDR